MASERSLASTTLSSRKNVTSGSTCSASLGLCSRMLKWPRTLPKTLVTASTTRLLGRRHDDAPAVCLLDKVVRKRCGDAKWLIRHRMCHFDLSGVQHRPDGVAYAI